MYSLLKGAVPAWRRPPRRRWSRRPRRRTRRRCRRTKGRVRRGGTSARRCRFVYKDVGKEQQRAARAEALSEEKDNTIKKLDKQLAEASKQTEKLIDVVKELVIRRAGAPPRRRSRRARGESARRCRAGCARSAGGGRGRWPGSAGSPPPLLTCGGDARREQVDPRVARSAAQGPARLPTSAARSTSACRRRRSSRARRRPPFAPRRAMSRARSRRWSSRCARRWCRSSPRRRRRACRPRFLRRRRPTTFSLYCDHPLEPPRSASRSWRRRARRAACGDAHGDDCAVVADGPPPALDCARNWLMDPPRGRRRLRRPRDARRGRSPRRLVAGAPAPTAARRNRRASSIALHGVETAEAGDCSMAAFEVRRRPRADQPIGGSSALRHRGRPRHRPRRARRRRGGSRRREQEVPSSSASSST